VPAYQVGGPEFKRRITKKQNKTKQNNPNLAYGFELCSRVITARGITSNGLLSGLNGQLAVEW
jgi:hypothetical protein